MADIEVEMKFSLNDVEEFRDVLMAHEAICAGLLRRRVMSTSHILGVILRRPGKR